MKKIYKYHREKILNKQKDRPLIVSDYHGVLPTLGRMLSNHGFRVIVITGTNKEVLPYIQNVSRDNHINIEKVICMPDKYYQYKARSGYSRFRDEWKIEKIAELKPDFFIDNEEYMIRQVSKRCPGTTCLLVYADEKWFDGKEKKFRELFKDDRKALRLIKNLV